MASYYSVRYSGVTFAVAFFGGCLVLALFGIVSPAAAQNASESTSTASPADGGIAEIVVTARKRTESESTTPRFYTVLGYDPGTVVPGTPADNFAFVNRARQVMLQFTFRPNHL